MLCNLSCSFSLKFWMGSSASSLLGSLSSSKLNFRSFSLSAAFLALPVFEPRYVWPCILSWAQKLASGQISLTTTEQAAAGGSCDSTDHYLITLADGYELSGHTLFSNGLGDLSVWPSFDVEQSRQLHALCRARTHIGGVANVQAAFCKIGPVKFVRSRSKLRNEGRGQLCARAKSFHLWQLILFLPLRICGNHSNSKQSEAL